MVSPVTGWTIGDTECLMCVRGCSTMDGNSNVGVNVKFNFSNSFRIPHKPPAGSLKVLRAPARWGGIWRASQFKIYNLETNEFVSNPPFSKNEFGGSNIVAQLWQEQLELFKIIFKNFKKIKLFFNSRTLSKRLLFWNKSTKTEPLCRRHLFFPL